jgi:hypothetical protein
VVASDQRFAYFGTRAFAIRLLRLDEKIVGGMPMSLKRVAQLLGTDAILFQEFCDRFSKHATRRWCSRTGRRSRRRCFEGASHFARRLAHFNQLQLAPKLGRCRLKSNLLCLIGHRCGETLSALDLAAQIVGVSHFSRSLVRFTMQRFGQ